MWLSDAGQQRWLTGRGIELLRGTASQDRGGRKPASL